MFEPENIIKILRRDMILPKFGEYKYYHEIGSKPEHILFWIRDTIAVFKKETQLLTKSGDINLSNIDRTDIVVAGDHGHGAFQFPIKILFIINNEKRHESIQSIGYMLYKKDYRLILIIQ